MNILRNVAAPLLLVLAGQACASDCLPRLRDGWIRLAPGGMAMSMLAGYGRIENPCAEAVVVDDVSSPAFASASVHRTSIANGVSRMRDVSELPIAAGSAALLAPGGLHLMLMQPVAPIAVGTSVPVRFHLRDGREVRGELVARAAAP